MVNNKDDIKTIQLYENQLLILDFIITAITHSTVFAEENNKKPTTYVECERNTFTLHGTQLQNQPFTCFMTYQKMLQRIYHLTIYISYFTSWLTDANNLC